MKYKKSRKLSLAVIAVAIVAGMGINSVADNLIRPYAAGDALGTETYPFGTLRASGLAYTGTVAFSIGGPLTVTGAVDCAAAVTMGSTLSGATMSNNTVALKAAANVADGDVITFTPDTMIVYTPTGMAKDETVTITITNRAPSFSGVASKMYIANSSSSTGLIAFSTATVKGLNTTLSTGECAVVVNFGTTNIFRLIK